MVNQLREELGLDPVPAGGWPEALAEVRRLVDADRPHPARLGTRAADRP